MHAYHPWNVTLTSRLFPSGSLVVVRTIAIPTPPAGNWSMAWKPLFSVHLYCWGVEA